jgi:MurNAc alpha-1-phosphate uridylyltransferase
VKCDHAHLVLVPNPEHNPAGDFALEGARLRNSGEKMGTFSGIAVYHPRLFAESEPGRFSVVPMLRQAIGQTIVTGEWHRGIWSDVGTLERLQAIREIVQ